MVLRLNLLLDLTAIVATWALLGWLTTAKDAPDALFLVLVGLWGAFPYALLLGLPRWLRGHLSSRSEVAILAGSLLAILGAAALDFLVFVARPDPQSGLVLIFLPFYQSVLAAVTLLVAGLLGRRRTAA
jgi:hypothetical protein